MMRNTLGQFIKRNRFVVGECKTCKKEIRFFLCHKRKFCSLSCYNKLGHNEETRRKISESQKGKRIGDLNPFWGKKHSKDTREKLSIANIRRDFNGSKHPNWKGGKPQCSDCGKKLTNYISKRCVVCKGKLIRGSKNWNWRGGVTPLNEKIRKSEKYKLWRKAVFERDNYTCKNCGLRSRKGKKVVLHADHIKPFSLFPELRFILENGRTLCEQCHYRIGWSLFRDANPNRKFSYENI